MNNKERSSVLGGQQNMKRLLSDAARFRGHSVANIMIPYEPTSMHSIPIYAPMDESYYILETIAKKAIAFFSIKFRLDPIRAIDITYGFAEWNAYYDNNRRSLLFGKDFLHLDIVGHEYTHLLRAHVAGELNANFYERALDEHLADCGGAMFKQYCQRTEIKSADWKIGSDLSENGIPLRFPLRDLAQLGPQRDNCYQNLKDVPSTNTDYYALSQVLSFVFVQFCNYCRKNKLARTSYELPGQIWFGAMRSLAKLDSGPCLEETKFYRFPRLTVLQLSKNPACSNHLRKLWEKAGFEF